MNEIAAIFQTVFICAFVWMDGYGYLYNCVDGYMPLHACEAQRTTHGLFYACGPQDHTQVVTSVLAL